MLCYHSPMPIYNRPADAANLAVRAFLIKVSEHYLERPFNTVDGKARREWIRIRDELFQESCAYCGETPPKLELEHLIMFNQVQLGFHHPGNIVPACKSCNCRKKSNGKFITWQEQLRQICIERGEEDHIEEREQRITGHIEREHYPRLTEEERQAISEAAQALYKSIQSQIGKSVSSCWDVLKHLPAKEPMQNCGA